MASDTSQSETGSAGSAPDTIGDAAGATALLIIDMINGMAFEDAADLRAGALTAAKRILALRDAADAQGVPTIYVNDNDDQWHSERTRIVERALSKAGDARDMVERLAPRADDYFVIKPQFSGFYATNLPVLLPKLGARRLILTGISADICILFTAADAHMRDYRLWVPADAVASTRLERAGWALEIMAQSMGADVRPTSEATLAAWLACG